LNNITGTSTLQGAVFTLGTTNVVWTITDGSGNTASCSYNVVVVDSQNPTITCPANVVVSTNSGCNATDVNIGTPTVSDNCSIGSVTNDHPSTTYPQGTTTVTWTVTDGSGNTATCQQTVTVNGLTISGNFKYYNPDASYPVLSNINVELWQGGVSVYGPVTTNASGQYSFSNVCSGTYDVVATTTKPSAGAINSTDAAQVNYWGTFGNAYSIEKVRFYTGDGAMDNWLDAADASRILKYFTTSGAWGWNNRPKWTFWHVGETINDNILPLPSPLTQIDLPAITVGNSNLNKNFYGMVTGDFNYSFVPSAKSTSQSLTLTYDQKKVVEAGETFELPVTAGMDMEVGAVSLIMNFPSDKLEITGVHFGNNPNEPVEYNVDGDEVRIGWYSMNAVDLGMDQTLLTLTVKAIGSISKDETFRFELTGDPLNELADFDYKTINGAILKMAELSGTALGTGEVTEQSALNLVNNPNPFKKFTTFEYTLPVDGKVTLEINNLLGSHITTLVDEMMEKGKHSYQLDTDNLVPGVYTATIRLITANGTSMTRTIKIVRNH
jgi:hypothetical protein